MNIPQNVRYIAVKGEGLNLQGEKKPAWHCAIHVRGLACKFSLFRITKTPPPLHLALHVLAFPDLVSFPVTSIPSILK
jgi:hypothetical protein